MRRVVLFVGGAAAAAAALAQTHESLAFDQPAKRWGFAERLPSRQEQLQRLSRATAEQPYDLLVIGGGATGTGCALDGVTR